MKLIRKNSNNTQEENIFWASMSDLLLGLTIVFIALFALSITGLTKQNIEKENLKHEIAQKLVKELESEDINVEVDKFTGNIKISDLELFKINEWKISENGKDFLNKFAPIYFDTILGDQQIRENISQILIEGHTDSQSFKNSKSDSENYTKNLELSIKRAFSVSEHIINLDSLANKEYSSDLYKYLSTNGRSYSSPVLTDGKEDFSKSRRVELKFQLKDGSFIELLRKHKFSKDNN